MAWYNTDLSSGGTEAEKIAFDNNVSGINANNVQGAIDKLSEHVGLYKKNYLNNKATTSTINGVTFTVNNDKSVTVNGTATSNAVLLFDPDAVKYDGDFILSGNSVNGSNSTFCMFVANYDSNGNKTDEFLGNKKEIQLNSNSMSYRLGIIVYSGATVDNITFYPMVRYASIEDDTYEPYVEDVQTKVNRLYDITKISIDQSFTSSTANANIWTYTAGKKCLINISVTFGNYEGKPIDARAYIVGRERPFVWQRNEGSDGRAMCIPVNIVLEKGEQILITCAYNNATLNRYFIEGYRQNLE